MSISWNISNSGVQGRAGIQATRSGCCAIKICSAIISADVGELASLEVPCQFGRVCLNGRVFFAVLGAITVGHTVCKRVLCQRAMSNICVGSGVGAGWTMLVIVWVA